MGKLLRLLVILVTSVCVASPALAQQRGTISGTVSSEGNQPLAGATVLVAGTALRGVTDQAGQYRIVNVPAGTHDVTASVLGYSPRTQRVTVAADGTASASFQLSASALEIGGLVVTATGAEQRRREIGSSVGAINTANVELAPVTNVAQLIQGRVPGAVVMQASGTTGTGSRVRIRGNNSLTLSNAPLLIIDGVRVQSSEESLGFGVGGQSVSRLNDLNPEDIENIDILKGPAASALYGTAAANGVIQVTTKRGRAGRPQFRVWTESGREEKNVTFPDNVQALDSDGNPCPIFYQAEGFCTPSQTYTFNPLEAEGTFRKGNRRTLGGSASGGSTDATFYVSGEYEDAEGIQFNNNYKRVNVQANLTGNLGEKLRLGANVGLVESDLELPLADNASFGLFGMGLYGSPSPDNVELQGGFESDPDFAYDWKTFQDVSRFTGSTNANYRPLSWLNINGTVGLDRTDRDETFRIPRDNVYAVFGAPYTFGMIDVFKTTFYNLTTNASGTAQFDLSSDLASTTSVGTQYLRETSQSVEAFGATLTPGIETSLAGASTDFDVAEGNVKNATVSAYVQQQLAWRDRLFLNASARGDQNSAFGVNLGWVWYPAFSGAWVVSDEPFFPDLAALNTLRLRAAWGQSGLRPGSTDAQLAYTSIVSVFGNTNVPGFAINELGNVDLKPERVTELELGFDTEFFDNRLGVELTHFNKKSTDALVRQPLAPSSGAGSATSGTAGTRFVNLGEVQNTGWELLLRGQPIRTNDIGLSFTLSGSSVKNRLNSLGEDTQGNPIPPIVLSTRQRHAEGYALGGWWMIPVESFADANNDGLLSSDEVNVGVRRADGSLKADSVAYFGSPFPTREASFNANFNFREWLRVSALFDHKGGHKLVNMTRAWRCVDVANCAAAYDVNTPLEEQAAMVARGLLPGGTWGGFVEDADFVKFRELSLTLGLPSNWADRFGASGLSLTLAGRNLKTWTDYSGFDPEVNFSGTSNFTSGDYATIPANKLFTARVDVTF